MEVSLFSSFHEFKKYIIGGQTVRCQNLTPVMTIKPFLVDSYNWNDPNPWSPARILKIIQMYTNITNTSINQKCHFYWFLYFLSIDHVICSSSHDTFLWNIKLKKHKLTCTTKVQWYSMYNHVLYSKWRTSFWYSAFVPTRFCLILKHVCTYRTVHTVHFNIATSKTISVMIIPSRQAGTEKKLK